MRKKKKSIGEEKTNRDGGMVGCEFIRAVCQPDVESPWK
jgi:hypothetical protein